MAKTKTTKSVKNTKTTNAAAPVKTAGIRFTPRDHVEVNYNETTPGSSTVTIEKDGVKTEYSLGGGGGGGLERTLLYTNPDPSSDTFVYEKVTNDIREYNYIQIDYATPLDGTYENSIIFKVGNPNEHAFFIQFASEVYEQICYYSYRIAAVPPTYELYTSNKAYAIGEEAVNIQSEVTSGLTILRIYGVKED